MVIIFLLFSWFHCTGCAWERTKQAPWYMPDVRRMCCGLCCMREWWWFVYYVLDFITPIVHGHGRGKRLGTCLVLKPCVLCVMSLQHVPMFKYAGCARAWTSHAPLYVPSVHRMCRGHFCMRDSWWIVLPKVVICTLTTHSCNMRRQSCVADSIQQPRSSIKKVSNEKHNFSNVNIFVCDDHANYLQLYIYI